MWQKTHFVFHKSACQQWFARSPLFTRAFFTLKCKVMLLLWDTVTRKWLKVTEKLIIIN